MKPRIAVVDCGIGNLRSVQKAFEKLGATTVVTTSAGSISESDAIILPGDGAFKTGMKALEPLKEKLFLEVGQGKPLLGICLGMQVLFSTGFEGGKTSGLGFLEGEVKRFEEGSLKVPQIGWNRIESLHGRLFEGVDEGQRAYFLHSYYCEPKEKPQVCAETGYGIMYASAVERNNLFGVQFHPEKSSAAGLKMLENFIEVVKEWK